MGERPEEIRSTSGRYVATQHAMIAVHISTPERMPTGTLSPASESDKSNIYEANWRLMGPESYRSYQKSKACLLRKPDGQYSQCRPFCNIVSSDAYRVEMLSCISERNTHELPAPRVKNSRIFRRVDI